MDIQTAKEIIKAAAVSDDTVLIQGPHGIGKSDIVKQFAKENDYHLEELFLSHNEVSDIIGNPRTIMEDGIYVTTWSIPPWLHRMNKSGKKCILFLDEFNRGPLDVKQSALQLILERKIHEHKLPIVDDIRTMVVAAINPADDIYQVDETDPALIDRFCFIEVNVDADSWLKWAKDNDIADVIIDFISENPDKLHFLPIDGGKGCSPRSWAKLSNYLKNKDIISPAGLLYSIIGKIGLEVGTLFNNYLNNYSNILKIEDVINIVNSEAKNVNNITEISEILKDKISNIESMRLTELATQFKYKPDDVLPMLVYLYALPIEICISFLQSLKIEDNVLYKKIVKIDTSLNNKQLFTRIVKASDKS